MPADNDLFTAIEKYDKMIIHYLTVRPFLFPSAVVHSPAVLENRKLMRHMQLQPSGIIPCDEEFAFLRAPRRLSINGKLSSQLEERGSAGRNYRVLSLPLKKKKTEEDATNGAAAISAANLSAATSVDVTMTETLV